MVERRRHQPRNGHLPDAALTDPGERDLLLQHHQSGAHSRLVRAASICWATSGGARAHSAETDFTGENVRSYPATGTCAGRDAEARNPVNSPSSTGARPCRSRNTSRATWVRIRARSSAGIGWFHTSP